LTNGCVIRMTECIENHIFGKSTEMSKEEGIKDSFDLFIFTCGWESRCKEIIKYDTESFLFDSAAIISFKQGIKKGYLPEYMKEIKDFAKGKIGDSEIIVIEEEPNELDRITGSIRSSIQELLKRLRKPFSIGFDITSCPRYFFLYLLGFCLEYNITKDLSFFYSEGKYRKNHKEYIHTKGKWKTVEIAGFENKHNPEGKLFFVVSAGFEGNRYRSLVSKYEPDLVGILLPDPGFHPEYTEQVKNECQPMIDEFNIPPERIVSAPAGDAIAAWEALKSPCLNEKKDNIIFLTCGPKPHVLAMGLHASTNKENISVIYRVPEGYTRMEVEAMGKFWRYDIKNLTIL
jgi:hypothetical protein